MISALAPLTVVGTGIQCGIDLSTAAREAMTSADELLFIACDPLSRAFIEQLRPDSIPLSRYYGADVSRMTTYAQIVERVMESVRAGRTVCFAVPGHPAVFAQPTHRAIQRARAEGYDAVMLPALSAADHAWADLGVDPGEAGSATHDATDFVIFGRRPDHTADLFLWQIDAIGETFETGVVHRRGLAVLRDVLLETYPANHDVVVYEAARYAITDPSVVHMRLDQLAEARVSGYSMLYVPASEKPSLRSDRLTLLGLMAVPELDEAVAALHELAPQV